MTSTQLANPASAARAAANRLNSHHSTGPNTAEGKDRMRFNALQHGLYAAHAVIPGEDEQEYHRLGAQLAERFCPANAEERELLTDLQEAQWRLKRVVALETRMHLLSTAQQLESVEAEFGPLDPETQHALASAAGYRANARVFAQLNRQEAKLRKIIETTTKSLLNPELRPGAVTAAAPSPAAEPPAEPVGFVPTLSPEPVPEPAPEPAHTTASAPAAPKMPKFSGPQAAQHRKNWIRKQRQKEAQLA